MTRLRSRHHTLLRPAVLLLVAGATLMASACGGSTQTSRAPVTESPSVTGTATPEPSTSTSLGTDGSQIFAARCASCHGSTGEGNLGPGLVGIADRMSAQDQIGVVTNGRGTMPAFSRGLTVEQIQAVVDYTRTQMG